jgi:hypothetical protein
MFMLDCLQSSARSRNDGAEAFGVRTATADDYAMDTKNPEQINANAIKKLIMPVHCGMFTQPKYLPLGFLGPLVIELDLISDKTQAFRTIAESDVIDWQVEDAYLLADTVTLDNQMQNEYVDAVNNGNTLPLHISTWHTIMQGNPSQSQNMTLLGTRGYSRLKTILFTMFKPISSPTSLVKRGNLFYFPGNSPTYDPARDILTWYVQIGSKRYPEAAVSSQAESFYRLRQAVGKHWGDSSVGIHPAQYRSTRFIGAIDLEKLATAPGADDTAFSGVPTTNGQIVQVEFGGLHSGTTTDAPTEVYVTFHADVVLHITRSGVDVLV